MSFVGTVGVGFLVGADRRGMGARRGRRIDRASGPRPLPFYFCHYVAGSVTNSGSIGHWLSTVAVLFFQEHRDGRVKLERRARLQRDNHFVLTLNYPWRLPLIRTNRETFSNLAVSWAWIRKKCRSHPEKLNCASRLWQVFRSTENSCRETKKDNVFISTFRRLPSLLSSQS